MLPTLCPVYSKCIAITKTYTVLYSKYCRMSFPLCGIFRGTCDGEIELFLKKKKKKEWKTNYCHSCLFPEKHWGNSMGFPKWRVRSDSKQFIAKCVDT